MLVQHQPTLTQLYTALYTMPSDVGNAGSGEFKIFQQHCVTSSYIVEPTILDLFRRSS